MLGIPSLAWADPPTPPYPSIGASGDEPLCWMLEPPPGWSGCVNDPDESSPWIFDPHFVPMLTLNKNAFGNPNPGVMYGALKTQYNRYISIIDYDALNEYHFQLHIAVGKFNFGDSNVDDLDFWAAPGGTGPGGQPHVEVSGSPTVYSEMHPWMWSKVDSARDWAEDFVDAWKSDSGSDAIPSPVRFLLDTERQVFGGNGYSEIANTALLNAILADDRASEHSSDPTKHNLPYPGAATTSTNKPLIDWLDDADAVYGTVPQINLNPLACISGQTTNYNVLEYGWGSGLDLGFTLGARQNIARYQWYQRLWNLSFDAAFDRAIYSVVSDSTIGWGSDCKTAMYAKYDVPHGSGFSPLWSDVQRSPELFDVAEDYPFGTTEFPFTFGWSFDLAIDRWAQNRNDILTPACRGTAEVRVGGVATNVALLGKPTNDREGATQQYTAAGRWSMHTFNSTTADFDAPVLYAVKQFCSDVNSPYALPDHQRPNLYLPPWSSPRDPALLHNLYEVDPSDPANMCPRDDHYRGSDRTCLAPPETLEQASVRVARRTIESIAAGKGGQTNTIVPWIPLVGAELFSGTPTQNASVDLVRQMLGLLRSKDIHEIQVYGERFPVCPGSESTKWPVMANWEAFQTVYNEVYNLGFTDYAILNGYYIALADEFEALSRTNLELSESPAALVPVTMMIESETVYPSNTEVTAVVVEMRGTRLAPSTNGILRVVLEGDVERLCTPEIEDPEFCPQRCIPQGADMKDIRGLIYAFEWGTSQWVQLTTTDYSDGSYGFFAPPESCRPYDPTFAGSFRSMRRTFEFSGVDLTDFVKTETSGEYVINLKLVQTGVEPFITKYDLVQCLYINGSSVGASPACDPLPELDEPEENPESMLAWGPGDPQGGDMNYDGWHCTQDTMTFSQAYINGHPSADVNNDGVIDNADVLHYFAAIEEEQ